MNHPRGIFHKSILFFVALLFVFGSANVCTLDVTAASKAKVTTVSSVKKNVTFTNNNLTYTITSVSKKTGTVTVTGCKKVSKKLVIPDTVKVKKSGTIYTLKVTAIGDSAFRNSTALTEVSVGKYVEKIGKESFTSCYKLKKVQFKKGSKLKKIDNYAFAYDTALKSMNFDSLKVLDTISDNAFTYCRSLTNIPRNKLASIKKQIKKISKYTYEVTPVMAPFNKMFYVETNNPDGKSFCLADYHIDGKLPSQGYILMYQDTKKYADVLYEKESKLRVKGGYIFRAEDYEYNDKIGSFNGGQLSLMIYATGYGYIDTGIKVDCPDVEDGASYLLERFTTSAMDMKTKAISISNNLLKYYPGEACIYNDVDTSGKIKFPYYYLNGYGDMSENFFGMYKDNTTNLLADAANPLSGYGANRLMVKAMKKAYPNSTYNYSYYSGYKFKNGEETVTVPTIYKTSYMYKSTISKDYKFDSSTNDKLENPSLRYYKGDIEYYKTKGDVISEKIKSENPLDELGPYISSGAWYRIYNGNYIYATEGSWYIHSTDRKNYKDTWVDGRYIDSDGAFVKGAKFEEHPNADIVLTNQTYKNVSAKTVTGDITYEYNATTDTWESVDYYITSYSVHSWTSNNDGSKPAAFTLTRQQVQQLNVDRNTNSDPAHGYIFDGTVKPGTTF
ncbi:MAG: leucine-rich repeat domain-containing protein [Wujia sp.]